MREGLKDTRGQRGCSDLLAMHGSRSQKHVGNERTVLDKRLASTNDLYAISSRLLDANSVLEECCNILLGKDSAFLKRRQQVNNL